ncbi:MAG: pyruvate kinase [Devosiaceae bacterium]|nr:pyruvate kinase [Devosiaceae bacterium]
MKRSRRVKILATLGPASDTLDMITKLVEAGADLFRINMSHASHDLLDQTIERIRLVENALERPLGILVDLQGPKIRIGKFVNDAIELKTGDIITLDSSETEGNESRVFLPHPELFEAVKTDHRLLLDDGRIQLKAQKVTATSIQCVVVHGGKLSNKKGVSVPDSLLNMSAMTDKDRADLNHAITKDIDWVALSFVQRPQDITDIRKITRGRVGVMAKIEKPQAVECLDEIIKLCDAFMIARGDLGVEMPLEEVPGLQKRMIRLARKFGKPVGVATQMLESMIENARPTRAEASDVATAVYDGADCVMLSAETAVGAYPVQAVAMMDRIARTTESDQNYLDMMEAARPEALNTSSDAITTAAYYVAQDVDAKLIVNYTLSGSTALRTARQRPEVPILCLTPDLRVARRLMLSYGVYAVHDKEGLEDFTGPARHAAKIAVEKGFLKVRERFIMTAGMPFGVAGSTNILRIAKVEPDK